MEYTSPGAALSQGFTQGVDLSMNWQKAKQQRDTAAFQQQLRTAELGMKLVEDKDIPLESRMNAFNTGVRPVLLRLGVNMPEMTAPLANNDSFKKAVASSASLMDRATTGDLNPHVAINGVIGHFNNALNDIGKETEAQTAERTMIMGNMKSLAEEWDKKQSEKRGGADEQAKALARQTELGIQYSNLIRTGTVDPAAAKAEPALAAFAGMFDKGKLSPDEQVAVGNVINRERQYLNTKIEDPRLRTPVMYQDEYQAAMKAGYKPTDLHLSNIVVPSRNPAPRVPVGPISQGPVGGEPVVASAPSSIPPTVNIAGTPPPTEVASPLSLTNTAPPPYQQSLSAQPDEEQAGYVG